MESIGERFQKYHSGVTAGMYKLLAEELGVTTEAIEQLGVGYDYRVQAWVFAERDISGEVIGLSYRYENGKKGMSPDFKGRQSRGLVYPVNQGYGKGVARYVNGQHNWIRITDAGVICPVCGKPDGCLVSRDCPDNPAAAICIRPQAKEGATTDLGDAGYLHVFKQGKTQARSLLPESERAVLIVEGASDVLAAMSMGFVGIGRPSAEAGISLLSRMPLTGRDVWIIGENDAGAGKEGMEKTYAAIKGMTGIVRKFLPPEGIKDLRAWYIDGLTAETLLTYVSEQSTTEETTDGKTLPDGQATTIARAFLRSEGGRTLHNYRGEWYVWKDGKYTKLDTAYVRGRIYSYAEDKSFVRTSANGGKVVVPIPATRGMSGDVLDCMVMPDLCPVVGDVPKWLTKTNMPDPRNLIVFKNGILDVAEYMDGRIKVYDSDSDLFVMNTFPYSFDEDADSKLCRDYIQHTFNNDPEVQRLIAQWYGYNAVPDTSQEKMMLFTGPPRSGKSTMLDMLRAMLGQEQCCSLQMRHLMDRFGRHIMLGKLAAMFGDVRTPRANEADVALQMLLSIIGQDPVPVDRKNIAELPHVKLFCRFTMAMNDIPAFSDHARALAPRMNAILFPNSYVGHEDRGLKGQLEDEASKGKLINWALAGLKDLRTRGRFVEPVSSMNTTRTMELASTPALAFIDECCVTGRELARIRNVVIEDRIRNGNQVAVLKDELYAAWKVWCETTGRHPGLKDQFCRWILNACPTLSIARLRVSKTDSKFYWAGDSERAYYFINIDLTNDARRKYLT
jgi:putative DNA primase/helicase